MMRPIHTITLNPVIDLIYEVDEFEKGTTFRCGEFHLIPAGKGLNVSNALATMGEETRAYIPVGWRESGVFAEACRERGIHYHPYPGVFQTRYHCSILETRSRSTTHIQVRGDRVPLSPIRELTNDLKKHVQPGDWVALSGSIPPGVPTDIYAKLIENFRKRKINSLLDASGEPLRKGALAKPDLLKVNQAEAEELSGIPARNVNDACQSLRAIYETTHTPLIALSMGKQGLVAGIDGEILHLRVPMNESAVKDTTGCGDAMVAGMLYGLNRGFDPEALFRYGIACASAAALCVGPAQFEWSDMEKMLNLAQVSDPPTADCG